MNENRQELYGFISNQSYVKRNLIPVVTRNICGDKKLSGSIKELMEFHPTKICGLKTSFSVNELGGVNHVIYDLGAPIIHYIEKCGKSIQHTFDQIAERLALQDNESKTIDVLFIEPDHTCTEVVDAWHCLNMYPSSFSGTEGIRDLSNVINDTVVYKVEFSCETLRNNSILELAQTELKVLNLKNINKG